MVRTKAKVWKLKELELFECKLTPPEQMFVDVARLHYPVVHRLLKRSNAPYEGTGYKSDFTIVVDHPWYQGIVIEIQGGIYSRYRSGHSSVSGLIRDYSKAACAQRNRWFFLQVAPDDDSIDGACAYIREFLQEISEENDENERLLDEMGASNVVSGDNNLFVSV